MRFETKATKTITFKRESQLEKMREAMDYVDKMLDFGWEFDYIYTNSPTGEGAKYITIQMKQGVELDVVE